MQEPLIGLGFADSIKEVKEMINAVGNDGSLKIDFSDFLEIIRNGD